MAVYLDRKGTRISGSQWDEYNADEKYKYSARYENDRFRIQVAWYGKMAAQTPLDVPRDHWKLFQVEFYNIIKDANGNDTYALDPEMSKFLNTEEKAMTYYHYVLTEYTDCVADVVELGKGSYEVNDFIELGNKFDDVEDDLEEFGYSSDTVIKKDYKDIPEAGSW